MKLQTLQALIAILLTFPVRAQPQPMAPQGEPLDIGPVPLEPLAKPSDEDLRGVEVILSTEETEFDLLAPVIAAVDVRNLANEDLIMPVRGVPMKDFLLIVRDERGKLVPLTRAGHQLYDRPPVDRTRAIARRIRKGAAARAQLPVNLIYDLTVPGKYQVVAFCYVAQRNGEKIVRVQSKPIELVIRGEIPQKQ